MFAAAKHLDNLIAFTDYNKLQIGGTVAEFFVKSAIFKAVL